MIDWLFYQQLSLFEQLFAREKNECFANDRTFFVAGRAQAIRVDGGRILLSIRLLGATRSEQKSKREYFRFYYVSQATIISGISSAR